MYQRGEKWKKKKNKINFYYIYMIMTSSSSNQIPTTKFVREGKYTND